MGPKSRIITNWEPYFVVYFQITLDSRHSPVLVKKHAHFMLMSSPSAHACATQDTSVWFQLLASPLTKWNIPVPSKLGRENRCVLQNRNGIFPTSELSFTRGFMYELMTDWWRIIINNILPLPESILDYSFKLTLNHQGPYNSKNE